MYNLFEEIEQFHTLFQTLFHTGGWRVFAAAGGVNKVGQAESLVEPLQYIDRSLLDLDSHIFEREFQFVVRSKQDRIQISVQDRHL